jgi:2-polyprenyl-3-methyl-5-hydroxy-6-metoxy-1,4-benzoquinol methylase
MAGIDTHDRVLGLLDRPAGGAVGDFGTGQGALADALARRGYQVQAFGYDARQYRADAPFVQCDLDDGIPLPDATLDGALAVEVIEHLENPNVLVRELARVVRPGGWIIVTTPNVLSLISKVAFAIRGVPTQFGDLKYDTNGHISPVSEHDLRRIAARAGLSIESVGYNVGLLPIPRVRHRLPLRGRFANRALGQSLIVKLRNAGDPVVYERG